MPGISDWLKKASNDLKASKKLSDDHETFKDFMIFNITQLPPEAWQQYQNLRLTALELDPLAFGTAYQEALEMPESHWRDFIKNMWFALIDNQPVGMIGLLRDRGQRVKHRAHIISFWVQPTHRGKGIGKKLVQYLQEQAPQQGIRKLYLYVTSTQEGAIKLYEALGFTKVGLLRENIYHQDTYFDQYLMEWHVAQ